MAVQKHLSRGVCGAWGLETTDGTFAEDLGALDRGMAPAALKRHAGMRRSDHGGLEGFSWHRGSGLRPAAIAHRYGRSRAAVTMATKQLTAEEQQNRELVAALHALATSLNGPEGEK